MSATGVTTTEQQPKAEGSPMMGGSGIKEGLSPAQAGGRRRRKTKGKRKSKAKRTRRRRRGRGRR